MSNPTHTLPEAPNAPDKDGKGGCSAVAGSGLCRRKLDILHELRMRYGRLCCWLWLHAPDHVAFESGLGDYLLSRAGYFTSGGKNDRQTNSPNDEMTSTPTNATKP